MPKVDLYQDEDDLFTVVCERAGWLGARWSSRLFVVDAAAVLAGQGHELDEPTENWAVRLRFAEQVATWCSDCNQLTVHDAAPGRVGSNYLGLAYDAPRWNDLSPQEFIRTVKALGSSPCTAETAGLALAGATPLQRVGLTKEDLVELLRSPYPGVRTAAVCFVGTQQPGQSRR